MNVGNLTSSGLSFFLKSFYIFWCKRWMGDVTPCDYRNHETFLRVHHRLHYCWRENNGMFWWWEMCLKCLSFMSKMNLWFQVASQDTILFADIFLGMKMVHDCSRSREIGESSNKRVIFCHLSWYTFCNNLTSKRCLTLDHFSVRVISSCSLLGFFLLFFFTGECYAVRTPLKQRFGLKFSTEPSAQWKLTAKNLSC